MSLVAAKITVILNKIAKYLEQNTPTLNRIIIHAKKNGYYHVALFVICSMLINHIFISMADMANYSRVAITFELTLSFILVIARLNLLACLMFIFSMINEVIFAISDKLQLLTIEQVMQIFSFVFMINVQYLIYIFLMLLLLALLFAGVIYSAKELFLHEKITAILISLLLPFVIAPNLIFIIINHANFGAVFNSVFLTNYQNLTSVKEEHIVFTDLEHPSAFDLTIKSDIYSDNRPAKILYITAESLGYPLAEYENILTQQLKQLTENPNITILNMGKAYAEGTTIAGEIRELCNKRSQYLSLVHMDHIKKLKISSAEGKDLCWPEYLKNNQYKIIAMHGANGKMYDRANLYNIIGFDEAYFDGKMPVKTNNRCKSWPGYCDLDLMDFVSSKLLEESKILFYWMSLNSHIPFDKHDIKNFDENICLTDLPQGYSKPLCNYHQLHKQFFDGLSNMLNNPKLQGLEIVIAGDHKPAFFEPNSEINSAELFMDNTVPYIHLKVNYPK